MTFMQENIKEKIDSIDALMKRLEENKNISVVDILKEEVLKLKKLNEEYRKALEDKRVMHKDQLQNKTRYYLKDGSTYVVKSNQYRYLYDAKTKVITYEFSNGQIEKTFPSGLREIRYPDGSIAIKNGPRDHEYIK
ncbi:hypothetical protein KMI_02g02740 [Encephalitozoon hellem]|uniref:Uncharacterized protein n=1 Tax=Encephalitozoon hellem TaxID=27973 RepID=A0A9Q9C4P6_ENCHE|nr:uncharacterized protein EHEL_100220 [Encephalitozoon hellem ATCC 50504]AFM99117.1 hypothetical protein EHEL_100220 [Encephalitozoon hellem ATCC 50504]KAG5860184.1 hypothetical protein KMI_02g02740 [Encephalitozoon hellem]UTX44101.1 hypothetical protein GPU96_10g18890 [Encephalitozoon hellem]WEL39590.1 hypothetical protein PFJ87_10g00360 [Encephalitozoon hellem]|eukprot:XP_003888098.1 hypothetical protein EHEL_100220 [Encephalitozoon hellem ATCC 50504]